MFLLILPHIIAELPLTAAFIACRGCSSGSPSSGVHRADQAHRQYSPPRLAVSVRPCSWLIFSFSSCHFSPCCSVARDAARVRGPGAAPRAFPAWICIARALSLRGDSLRGAEPRRYEWPPRLPRRARTAPRRERARSAFARAARCAFAFPAVPF